MQNKANLPQGKFDVSSFMTSKYEKLEDSGAVKNKAKQTQTVKRSAGQVLLAACTVRGSC